VLGSSPASANNFCISRKALAMVVQGASAPDKWRASLDRFAAWHASRAGLLPDEYSEEDRPADRSKAARAQAPVAEEEPTFGGITLTQVCMDRLRAVRRAQQTKDIWLALCREGYAMPWRHPTKPYKPVYNALLRREAQTGEVFRCGRGEWHLAEWYDPEEARRLKQQHVKAREEHIELTRRGMQEAKLRGRQIGKPRVMTPENQARVLQMARDGIRTKEIARILGVKVRI
jgi:hypothetical protein